MEGTGRIITQQSSHSGKWRGCRDGWAPAPAAPTALSQPGVCGRVLRVISCRTATVWKTLCPFWGESMGHCPLLVEAFYVMDGCSQVGTTPLPIWGLDPAPIPLWDCGSLCLFFTAWKEGSPGDLQGRRSPDVCSICVRVCGFAMLTHLRVHVCAGLCVHGGVSLDTGTRRERAGRVGRHTHDHVQTTCPERVCPEGLQALLHAGSCK